MRPSLLLAPFLLAGLTAGCVAYDPNYPQSGYAQPGYVDPGYSAQNEVPTYYNDRPAVIYGGQPTYIIEEPGLGWGWRDPDRRWHEAPRGWRGPGENDRFRQVYRQDARPDYNRDYRPDLRRDDRQNFRPDTSPAFRQDFRRDDGQRAFQDQQRAQQQQQRAQQDQQRAQQQQQRAQQDQQRAQQDQQRAAQQQQQQQRAQQQLPRDASGRRICPPGQMIC